MSLHELSHIHPPLFLPLVFARRQTFSGRCTSHAVLNKITACPSSPSLPSLMLASQPLIGLSIPSCSTYAYTALVDYPCPRTARFPVPAYYYHEPLCYLNISVSPPTLLLSVPLASEAPIFRKSSAVGCDMFRLRPQSLYHSSSESEPRLVAPFHLCECTATPIRCNNRTGNVAHQTVAYKNEASFSFSSPSPSPSTSSLLLLSWRTNT